MRVLVLGAYGLIGSYVAARLLREGHEVVGAGRNVEGARRRLPQIRWVTAELGPDDAEAWLARLVEVDAVVNCAGALQDSPRDDLRAVHSNGLEPLLRACKAAGVRRFVQVSAVGLEAVADPFHQTKLHGDRMVQECSVPWVILRPGLVLAPAAYGGSALLRGLAAFPGCVPILWRDTTVQIVGVDDVAEAVARSLTPAVCEGTICELVSEEKTQLGELVVELRAWLGFRPAPVVTAPAWLGRACGWAADCLALCGWRSPMRSTALRQLSVGVEGRSQDAPERLGFTAKPLREVLADWPSDVQERWFARLYFAKPLALILLALFWATSGIVGLVSFPRAVLLLTEAGFDPAAAKAFVAAGSVVDILLGVLVCHRATAAKALVGMVGLTLAYLIAAAIWTPHLWLDPLGPLVKSIPAAALALVVLGMMEER